MRRRGRRLTAEDMAAAGLFQMTVLKLADHECLMCGRGDCFDDRMGYDHRLTAAHVIPKQTLRKHGYGDKVWDPRNAVALGWEPCHVDHDGYRNRIPRSLLPESVFEFAAECELTWYLDKHFPEIGKAAA